MLRKLLLINLLITGAVGAQDFPGRENFQSVEVISTEQLVSQFDRVHIVDVRSPFEYSIIHIAGAENIPISAVNFLPRMRELAKDGKPLITYCNGHTCYKSYKAAVRAVKGGVKDVKAYDAGIFDWARANPDKAELLGQSPVDQSKLLSRAQLKEHMLAPKKFISKIGSGVTAVDIRGPEQRGAVGLFGINDIAISLESRERLIRHIRKFAKSGKTLLMYDEAGRQVRWVQYLIEAEGVKDYYFMQGGAKAFIKSLKSK
ncbi:MAG: rhodanese-like domain-containing protein [bacterium]